MNMLAVAFIVGTFFGAFVGIMVMCLVAINRFEDED